MILIADSGATKADWVALEKDYNEIFRTETLGISPEVLSKEDILERLKDNYKIIESKDTVTQIYFFGAGCGTERMKKFLKVVFSSFFNNAGIHIYEDTYAAVYATVNLKEPAIVCIMGTGSNCCYWDGKKIHQKVSSLGYIIMDDSSGNYYGRQLIRDFYFGHMPKHLLKKFSERFSITDDIIKENIYKKPNANKYLASFGRFMIENRHEKYCLKLAKKGFKLFIKNYILQFENAKSVPIHFIGSIAFYLKDDLKKSLEKNGLQINNVRKRPIDGLIKYIASQEIL